MRADDVGRDIFTISGEQFGRTQHLKLSGELDISTAPTLDRWLSKATSNGNAEVIVDLEQVTFMDASGLRALIQAEERARRRGQRFALVKTPAVVRRVIQLTDTTHLLHSEQPTVPWDPSDRPRPRAVAPLRTPTELRPRDHRAPPSAVRPGL